MLSQMGAKNFFILARGNNNKVEQRDAEGLLNNSIVNDKKKLTNETGRGGFSLPV